MMSVINIGAVLFPLVLAATICVAEPNEVPEPESSELPKALYDKIESLFELHKDSTAVWYPNWNPKGGLGGFDVERLRRIPTRTLELGSNQAIVLVRSFIENHGGTMDSVYYLAAFHRTTGENKQHHYRYMDSIPIGGKGWRFPEPLADATITHNSIEDKVEIEFDAKEVWRGDGLNFPSKVTKINLILQGGRFTETPQDDAVVPPYGKGNPAYESFWAG